MAIWNLLWCPKYKGFFGSILHDKFFLTLGRLKRGVQYEKGAKKRKLLIEILELESNQDYIGNFEEELEKAAVKEVKLTTNSLTSEITNLISNI